MPEYIAELRQLIGHRPILMVGAGVIVTDADGCVLLHQRSDNYLWSIPGGSMELNETVEEAARRETREETGLVLENLDLFGIFSGPDFFYEYPNGDQVYNVSVVFTSNVYHGELDASSDENLGQRFFQPSEIDLEHISPPVRPILARWLEINKG